VLRARLTGVFTAMAPQVMLDGPVRLAGYSDFVAVARGRDGVVYRARQDRLGRRVAVKVLLVDEPATVVRFRRELKIMVWLGRQHPHIVGLLDSGLTEAGQPCLVMEFYDHGSLHDQLRAHGPLPVAAAVAAGVAVADALAFSHAHGVLHRDVKPQNVLVRPTSYVLADFGIAHRLAAGQPGAVQLCSYRHAAPQVLGGEPATVADDVYSLGSTLFTLLDGRPPFAADDPDADSTIGYLHRARRAGPRPLARPDVPAELADIIARCLATRRADRFPDAAAVWDALIAVPARSPRRYAGCDVGRPALMP
jgi:serine/threonine protein kinase